MPRVVADVELEGLECTDTTCVLSEKQQDLLNKLNCRVFIRSALAAYLLYEDKYLLASLVRIRDLCRRYENGLRCISVKFRKNSKRGYLYVCLSDVIRMLMNAIEPKPLDAVLRQIEWGLPLALAQIKGLSNKDREELQFLVYEIITDKIIPWLEKKGLIQRKQISATQTTPKVVIRNKP